MPPPSPAPATLGIELIELETFIAVAQAQSFSMAAQRLHVTQPTVTGRVQRLEETLGVKLLRRTTRRVETTEQGEQLLVQATAALAGLSTLVLGLRRKARQARQSVVVAATPTLCAVSLPPIIQTYAQRYPDVEVQMLDLQYAGVLAAIEDGTADMGVLAFEGDDPRYRFQPLWSDDMLLVAPRNHALAGVRSVGPEAFSQHPLMLIEQHQRLRARIAAALQARGLVPPPSKVVANLQTLLGMLDAGLGITMLPRSIAQRPEVARHTLVEIEDIDLRRQFGIVLTRRTRLHAAGQSFLRHLSQSRGMPEQA